MRLEPMPEQVAAELILPLSTGEYTVPPITARDGMKLKALNGALEEIGRRVKAGDPQETATKEEVARRGISLDDLDLIEELALSKAVRDQMVADGAGLREVEAAGMTAFLWHTLADGGRAARTYWETGRSVPPAQ